MIRDDVGYVLATLSKNVACALGPSECEAKAMGGVTFAWDMGFRDVVFECDSKVVSDCINGYCDLPATIGNIIIIIFFFEKDLYFINKQALPYREPGKQDKEKH